MLCGVAVGLVSIPDFAFWVSGLMGGWGCWFCMVVWCVCGLLVWRFVCVFVCLSFWCCLCVSRFGFGFLVCVCFSVCLRCVWYSGLFVFMDV